MQKQATLIQLLFTTLGQERKWAYSTNPAQNTR